MPIGIDQFEEGENLRDSSTSERILRFLATRDDQAYTRGEIADAIDTDPETVGTNLTRLKKRGLVRHREPYWAFTDDLKHAAAVLRDRYGDVVVAELLDSDVLGETQDAAVSSSNDESTVHREATSAFLDRVRESIDGAVDVLYLFGSVAQGNASAESDIDILAVIAEDAEYATVDEYLLDAAYDVQMEYGVRIEVHSLRASEFDARRARGDPFISSVVKEGEMLV